MSATLVSESVFPTEIYERVIDHIRCDYSPYWATIEEFNQDNYQVVKTLCSCALTCTAWLPRSRVTLYRRLRLHNVERVTLTLLVRALDDNPALQQLVEILEVMETVNSTGASPLRGIWHAWPIMLAGRLPRLRCLGLYSQNPLGLDIPSPRTLTTFATVTELTIHWVGGPWPEQSCENALKLVKGFPRIQRLILRGALRIPGLLPSRLELSGIRFLHLDDNDSAGYLAASDLPRQLLRMNASSVETILWQGNLAKLIYPSKGWTAQTATWISGTSLGDLGRTTPPAYYKLRTIYLMLNLDSDWARLVYVAAWFAEVQTPCLENIVLSRRLSASQFGTSFPDHLANLLQASDSALDSALHSLESLHSLILFLIVSPDRPRLRQDGDNVVCPRMASGIRGEECQQLVVASAACVYERFPLLTAANKISIILHHENETNAGLWFCQAAEGTPQTFTQMPRELEKMNLWSSWP